MEFVNGKDDNPYMKWEIKHVWNHQSATIFHHFFPIEQPVRPCVTGPHLSWKKKTGM